MTEVNNKSAITSRNKRLKGERHAKRMAEQANRVTSREMLGEGVPRGTARNIRRAPLQQAYAKRKVA